MAETSGNYLAKVGIEQGADTFFIREDGIFKFFDQNLTGLDLKNILYPKKNTAIIINSAGVVSAAGGSSPPILPSYYGLIIFSMTDAASNASARLPSAKLYQELIIMMRGGGSTTSVLLLMSNSGLSGVVVNGILSGELSAIRIQGSSNSQPRIKLLGTAPDTWSVIEASTGIVLLAAS